MAQFINDLRDQYGQENIGYEDYVRIMKQFSKFDVRCQLDDQTLNELYEVLLIKQNGEVTYPSIEVLVFEFLIQQPLSGDLHLGKQAQKIPTELIAIINSQMVKDLNNFYDYICQSHGKNKETISFSEMEELGKIYNNLIELEMKHLLTILSFLKNESNEIALSEVFQLVLDLDQMISEHKNEVENEKYMDMSEQYNKLSEQTNAFYQGIDQLKQNKYLCSQDLVILCDLIRIVQSLETKSIIYQEDISHQQKQIEELVAENEELVVKLEQAEQSKYEQMKSLIADNDSLSNNVHQHLATIENMQDEINQLQQDMKSITQLETIARQKQLELDSIKLQMHEIGREHRRLKENNQALIEIINQHETKNDEPKNDEPNKNLERLHAENQFYKQEVEQLSTQLNDLRSKLSQQEVTNFKLEEDLKNSQRDAAHFKMLFESSTKQAADRNNFKKKEVPIQQNPIKRRFSQLNPTSLPHFSLKEFKKKQKCQKIDQILDDLRDSGKIDTQSNRLDTQSNGNPNSVESGPLKLADLLGEQDHHKFELQSQIIDEKQEDKQEEYIEEKQEIIDTTFKQLNEIENKSQKSQQVHNVNTLKVEFADFWDKFVEKEHKGDELEDDTKQSIKQYKPQQVFLQFDENLLYEKDYQGLRDETKITNLMEQEKQKFGKILQKCFSDQIFTIDAKGNKTKRIFYITEFNLYLFDESLRLNAQFELNAIQTIIFSESSPILCCMKIKGSQDYLFETFKRKELGEYLKEFCKFSLEVRNSFEVVFKGCKTGKRIEEIGKGVYVSGSKQSAYKISQKQGFLQYYAKKGFFGKSWYEVFVVLCEVGLIVFEKPGDLRPELFVPIADALIIKNPRNVERANVFKIQYSSSDLEFLFATISGALLEDWSEMVHQVIIQRVKSELGQEK